MTAHPLPLEQCPDTGDDIVLSLAETGELIERILLAHGLARPHVGALARVILAAERDACASHGVYRLAGIVKTLRSGKVNPDARPVVRCDDTAIVRVDADRGFSPMAFNLGIRDLAAKAGKHGIAAMAINHCFHFTALWPEVEALADLGLVSLAMTPSHSWVAPCGGSRPLLGTNPLAFGWPRPSGNPYIFDFATSAVARGEIELHHQRQQPIPSGWAVDNDGQSTTDPLKALSGALMTFGGHKGSALSTMIELIAGPLIGDLTSPQSQAFDAGAGVAPYHGELVIVLSPDVFLGDAKDRYLANAEQLLGGITAQDARLPSSRRYAARERTLREGIRRSATQYDILRRLLP